VKVRTIESLVQKKFDEFNENDMDIWRFIVSHKEICKKISIQQLAVFCHVSHTTILRFAKKLGFSGYSEMRSFLKWEDGVKVLYEEKDMEKNVDSFISQIRKMEEMDMTKVCQLIDQAEQIYINGSGEIQKIVAMEMKARFLYQNKLLNTVEGGSEIVQILEMITPKDLMIFITFSGKNTKQIEWARKVKEKGCPIILISMEGRGEFQELADIVIDFHPEKIDTMGFQFAFYPTLHFYIISEFIQLKYMEYRKKQKEKEE
jgi:RpiR family glv operon transcriptional regulator